MNDPIFDLWICSIKEQLQEDIISYFQCASLYPPFVFTEETKETMVDDLCDLVCKGLSDG